MIRKDHHDSLCYKYQVFFFKRKSLRKQKTLFYSFILEHKKWCKIDIQCDIHVVFYKCFSSCMFVFSIQSTELLSKTIHAIQTNNSQQQNDLYFLKMC